MSFNTKGPSLVARPERRNGRKVYRVENVGDRAATGIVARLRAGDADVSAWLQQGRVPAELAPGAAFLLGLGPDFQDAAVLTLTWRGPDGDERRWHGPVSV
ncbi:MAG: hypothetical protein K2R93_12505 [Gemmatimonadaceae bacterium]|nr:hypothetical protein [Gemmatimonadaceae bacterium]